MQPRRPPPPAPGPPRPAAPLLALPLLLLAVQGAAAPAGPEAAEWRPDTGPPHGLLRQAARAALHFLNFRAGSPSALRVLAAVQEGRARVSAGFGAGLRPGCAPGAGTDARDAGATRLGPARPPGTPAWEGPVGARSPRKSGSFFLALTRSRTFHRATPVAGKEAPGETEEQAHTARPDLGLGRWDLVAVGAVTAGPTCAGFPERKRVPEADGRAAVLLGARGVRARRPRFPRRPGREPAGCCTDPTGVSLAAGCSVAGFKALGVGVLSRLWSCIAFFIEWKSAKVTELRGVYPKSTTRFPVTPRYSTKPAHSASKNLE